MNHLVHRAAVFGSVFLLALCTPLPSTAQTAKELPEISVSATAESAVPAQRVVVRVSLDARAATATEAFLTLENGVKNMRTALLAVEPAMTLRSRPDLFTNAGTAEAPITAQTAVHIRRELDIETRVLSKTAALIDTALRHGAQSVLEVDYPVGGQSDAVDEAIDRATEAATQKASRVAAAMEVNLGPLLSAVVLEEPTGAAVRRMMQKGGSLEGFTRSGVSVNVSLRFQALPQSP